MPRPCIHMELGEWIISLGSIIAWNGLASRGESVKDCVFLLLPPPWGVNNILNFIIAWDGWFGVV